jgi:hypothetical protein
MSNLSDKSIAAWLPIKAFESQIKVILTEDITMARALIKTKLTKHFQRDLTPYYNTINLVMDQVSRETPGCSVHEEDD